MLDPSTIKNNKASTESIDLLIKEQKGFNTTSPTKNDKQYEERMSLLKQFASAIKDTEGKQEVKVTSFLDTKSQRSRYSATAVDRRVRQNSFATQGQRV